MMSIRYKENHMLKLSQEDYIKKVLKQLKMNYAKEVTTPFVSQDKNKTRVHNQGSLFFSSWEFDECHGLYKIGYCTSSESCD